MHLPPLRPSVVVAALAIAGLAGVPAGFGMASAETPIVRSADPAPHTVRVTEIVTMSTTSVRVVRAADKQSKSNKQSSTTEHRTKKNRTPASTTTSSPSYRKARVAAVTTEPTVTKEGTITSRDINIPTTVGGATGSTTAHPLKTVLPTSGASLPDEPPFPQPSDPTGADELAQEAQEAADAVETP